MNFKVLDFLDSATELYDGFNSGKPLLAGKIGNGELMTIYNYLHSRHLNISPIPWNPIVVRENYINAGVFPESEESRVFFCETLLNSLAEGNYIAAWNTGLKDFEIKLIKKQNINSVLIDLCALEPYYYGNPWTKTLKGKNVLVISPFSKSIEEQYKQRDKLFYNNVLPEFNLKTIHHPNSKAITDKNPYSSWKEMIDDIRDKMNKINFDVAIVGTGASSLPLASHAKKLGKQGIHLGGATQILFGIKGKRWNNMKKVNVFYNEYWKRPDPSEIPEKCHLVEDGCYW
jgi:hypothetical protein